MAFESENVQQVLEKPASHRYERPAADAASVTAPPVRNDDAGFATRLAVRKNETAILVKLTDVDYFQASANYVVIYAGGERHRIRSTLRALLPRLDPRAFMRIHKSTVVNLDRIKEIQPWFGGDHIALLLNGQRLRVSRTYARQLLRPVQ